MTDQFPPSSPPPPDPRNLWNAVAGEGATATPSPPPPASAWSPPNPPSGPTDAPAGSVPPTPPWDPWQFAGGHDHVARVKRQNRVLWSALATLIVVFAVLGGVALGHALWPSPATSGYRGFPFGYGGTTPNYGNGFNFGTPNGNGGNGGLTNNSAITTKVDPALVDVNVTFNGDGVGAGTGIVLTSNGEVLTNNHVVADATSISVTDIGNGKTYAATVVGYSRSSDVAVIQLKDASGLAVATIDSSAAAVGESVVVVGNAGGVGGTPSASGGTVTALGQSITASDESTGTSENLTGLIETNAGIVPGDSGGALVDSSGAVLGMNTAASEGFSFSGQGSLGYAIPIERALTVAHEIEAGQSSSTVHVGPTAYLGVLISSSGQLSNGSIANGALIDSTVSGTPAAAAGITSGDVITAIDNYPVAAAVDLTDALQHFIPGDRVQVHLTTATGNAEVLNVTLGSGPAQ